nr:MAG TPA: hypothetical protein [Caudoviricetes sp.]
MYTLNQVKFFFENFYLILVEKFSYISTVQEN